MYQEILWETLASIKGQFRVEIVPEMGEGQNLICGWLQCINNYLGFAE